MALDFELEVALLHIHPDGGLDVDENGNVVLNDYGVAQGYTVPTQAEIDQAILDTAYREERKRAYPPIGDQLDAMWKGGTDADDMKAQIDAVKIAHPKP